MKDVRRMVAVALLACAVAPGNSFASFGLVRERPPLATIVSSAGLIALVREDGSFAKKVDPTIAKELTPFGPSPDNEMEILRELNNEFARGVVLAAYKGTRRGEVIRYRLSPTRYDTSVRSPERAFTPYGTPIHAIVFIQDPPSGELVDPGRVTGSLEEMSRLGDHLRCVMDLQASSDEVIGRLRVMIGGDLFYGMTLDEFAASPAPTEGPCIPRTPAVELRVRTGFTARPESGPMIPLVLRLAGFSEDPAFDVAVLAVLEDTIASLEGTRCNEDGAHCTVPSWLRESAGLLEERVELASPRAGRPETLADAEATLRRISRRIRGG